MTDTKEENINQKFQEDKSQKEDHNQSDRVVSVDPSYHGRSWAYEVIGSCFAFGILSFLSIQNLGMIGGFISFVVGILLAYYMCVRLFTHINRFIDKKRQFEGGE